MSTSCLLCVPKKIDGCFPGDTAHVTEKGVDCVDPKDLRLEDCAEIARNRLGYGIKANFVAQFLLHRRDGLCGDAARDDQVEVAEIGVHVEREAV